MPTPRVRTLRGKPWPTLERSRWLCDLNHVKQHDFDFHSVKIYKSLHSIEADVTALC